MLKWLFGKKEEDSVKKKNAAQPEKTENAAQPERAYDTKETLKRAKPDADDSSLESEVHVSRKRPGPSRRYIFSLSKPSFRCT